MTDQPTSYFAMPKQPRLTWNDQSGVGFRIQFSFEGRMPYYYPDFLVRLTDGSLYIVESKGSIRERDQAKQSRAERYTDILCSATGVD